VRPRPTHEMKVTEKREKKDCEKMIPSRRGKRELAAIQRSRRRSYFKGEVPRESISGTSSEEPPKGDRQEGTVALGRTGESQFEDSEESLVSEIASTPQMVECETTIGPKEKEKSAASAREITVKTDNEGKHQKAGYLKRKRSC